jgi:hypothetical protein
LRLPGTMVWRSMRDKVELKKRFED